MPAPQTRRIPWNPNPTLVEVAEGRLAASCVRPRPSRLRGPASWRPRSKGEKYYEILSLLLEGNSYFISYRTDTTKKIEANKALKVYLC